MASEDTLGVNAQHHHSEHTIQIPHPSIEYMLNPVDALNVGRLHAVNVMGMDEVNRHGLIQSHPSLSFVTGPAIAAGGAAPGSASSAPTPTYMPVQIPGAIETAFAHPQNSSFAAPLVYPTTAYYPTAIPSPSPCTFLTAGPSITAVCHCVYAQPCALHHRPITYAPRSFPTLTGAVASVGLPPPTHAHVPPTPSAMPLVQVVVSSTGSTSAFEVPVLPSNVSPAIVRSSVMRAKRPAAHTPGPSSSVPVEPPNGVHAPKVRRITPLENNASMPSYQQPLTLNPRDEESLLNGASGSSSAYCECRCRAATECAPCLCHLHCRQHPSCTCTCPSASARREGDMNNPVHDVLLSSRMAQAERERQATNAWFRRQALAPASLVGIDVVTPRASPHPFLMFPRTYHPSLMELSMVLLQPHEATVVVGTAPTQSAETLPVGATVEQIQRYSTKRKYLKDCSLPENEQERCTVCLVDFETEDDVRSLRCDHVFHVGCIDRWLIYNKKCPVCRLDLDKA